MHPGLLVAATIGALSCAVFVGIARVVARREAGPDVARANRLLALWWLAVGVYSALIGFLLNLLGAFDVVDIRLFAAVRHVGVVVLCAGLFGLTAYFVYVLTGRWSTMPYVGLAYLGIYGFIAYVFADRRAVGVDLASWEARIVYDPPPEPALFATVLLLLALPQVLGALLYLLLAWRIPDRAHRYRGILVALGITVWFASNALAALGDDPVLRYVTRPLLGLVAAAIVYLAYRPPALLAARLEAARG